MDNPHQRRASICIRQLKLQILHLTNISHAVQYVAIIIRVPAIAARCMDETSCSLMALNRGCAPKALMVTAPAAASANCVLTGLRANERRRRNSRDEF